MNIRLEEGEKRKGKSLSSPPGRVEGLWSGPAAPVAKTALGRVGREGKFVSKTAPSRFRVFQMVWLSGDAS